MKAGKPKAKATPAAKKPGKKKVGDMMGSPFGGAMGPMTRPTPLSPQTGGRTRPPGATQTPGVGRPTGPTLGVKPAPAAPAPAANPGYGPPKRNDVLYARRHPQPGKKMM